MKIKFNTIKDVQEFVGQSNKLKAEVALVQGHWRIPATSIMSIFSLDLERPIKVEFDANDKVKVMDKLGRFIVED